MPPIAPPTSRTGPRGRRSSPAARVPLVPGSVRALAGALAALLTGGPALAQSVEITENGPGRVSIRAGGASASEVAEALSRETGISIAVTGDGSTAIDVDIVDEPIGKAVSQLAPNHLLMRADKTPDARITEIVLMMPDGDDGGVESTEFLPTGEPTDEIIAEDPVVAGGDGAVDENGQPIEAGLQILRDPDRAAAVRAAAASAVAAQAAQQAADLAAAGGQSADGLVDDGSGLPLVDGVPVDDGSDVDPATGLQLEGSGLLNR